MPYQPRPLLALVCAHCGRAYTARHVRRTYCSRSCNVRASHARNGRPADKRRTPVPEPLPVPVPVPVASPVAVPVAAPAPAPDVEAVFRQLTALLVAAAADRAQ